MPLRTWSPEAGSPNQGRRSGAYGTVVGGIGFSARLIAADSSTVQLPVEFLLRLGDASHLMWQLGFNGSRQWYQMKMLYAEA